MKKYIYTYDDLKNPSNNCAVATMSLLADKCGLSPVKVRRMFSGGDVYYDSSCGFRIDKRVFYADKNKKREKG